MAHNNSYACYAGTRDNQLQNQQLVRAHITSCQMNRHHPIPELTETQVKAFWSHVEKRGPDECWLWKGGVTKARNSQNYGIWHINNSTLHLRPHRVAYTLLVGPIIWPLTLDHVAGRCISTLCCNPAHLEPVAQGENVRRYYAARTHCKRGHELPEGGGSCWECVRITEKARRERRKARKIRTLAALTTPTHPAGLA